MSRLSVLIKWFFAIVLTLIAIVYLGYRIYWDFIEPVDTSTIYEYKVSLSVSAQGIAVRDESPLEDVSAGIEYYPLGDASRVATGEVVAELRRGGRVQGDDRKQELEREIQLLEEAQATAVDYTNTQVFNRDIKQNLGTLSSMASEGRYEELSDLRQNLTVNYNKKMISGGKAQDYSERLQKLHGELEKLTRGVAAETAATITASRSGYFSSVADGLESTLSPDTLGDLSVEELVALIQRGTPTPSTPRAGKLVLNENWVFAAAIPSQELEWINELMTEAAKKRIALSVQIAFEENGQTVPATVREIVQRKGGDTAVLLLECNWMNEDLINLRVENAELHFKEYAGLRINTSDLRFRTNSEGAQERGVYILRNNKVYFRLVDPIYEEAGFVLSKSYYNAQEYIEPQWRQWLLEHPEDSGAESTEDLHDMTLEEQEAADSDDGGQTGFEQSVRRYVIMFDQVITKGNDLHDEKVLRDY